MKRMMIIALIACQLINYSTVAANAISKESTYAIQNEEKSTIEAYRIIVEMFFEGFLERKPDRDGLEYWSNVMYTGEKSVAQVTYEMMCSEEFRNNNVSDEQFVKAIYRGVLGREADEDGLHFWSSWIKSGNSRKYFLVKSINSIEFIEKLNGYGINNIGNLDLSLNDKRGDIKELVNSFYVGFLGREADMLGLDYYTDSIINSRSTIADILQVVISSDEFLSKNLSNREFVQVIYRGVFGRESNLEDLDFWTSWLDSGNSKKYLLYNSIKSDEFISKVKSYGIDDIGNTEITLMDRAGEIKGLVNQFYIGFHGRNGDDNGINYFANQIINEKESITQILDAFISSDEFVSKNYSNEKYVQAMFRGLLGRGADKEGLVYWTDVLDFGNSRRYVLSQNIESEEFINNMKNYGIEKIGSINLSLEDIRGNIRQCINQFYIGLYGRDGDEGGLSYFTNEVIYRNQSIAKIITEFLNSDEFSGKSYSGEDFIKSLYKGILNREPRVDEINKYLSDLVNGISRKSIARDIFNSNEARQRFISIGINNIGEIVLSENDVQSEVGKGTIRVSSINLREKPSQQSNILTQVPNSGKIVVLGRVKGDLTYYKIQYVSNGRIYQGYIATHVSGTEVVRFFDDNANNEFLGVLSEKYESNGDPGMISSGVGDYGGKSYGAWQLSSKMGSLDGFVNWLKNENYEFHKKLVDARKLDVNTNCGPNFDKAWKEIANDHYNTFYSLQHKYTKVNYYDKLVVQLLGVGDYSEVLSSFAGRNVIWSTVVQHGVSGAYRIIEPLKNKTNVEDFIKAVYAERGRRNSNGELVHFISSSQAVQEGVASRFRREESDALLMYGDAK